MRKKYSKRCKKHRNTRTLGGWIHRNGIFLVNRFVKGDALVQRWMDLLGCHEAQMSGSYPSQGHRDAPNKCEEKGLSNVGDYTARCKVAKHTPYSFCSSFGRHATTKLTSAETT